MVRATILILTIFAVIMAVAGYRGATAPPVIRIATLHDSDWPSETPPIRIALLSDIHVAGPDMPPERLAGIVAQVNANKPDIVLVAGDFVSDKRTATHLYTFEQALAPLAGLESRFGTFAVPGNHDHWRGEAALQKMAAASGITLLQNRAIKVGPVVLVGVDDEFSGNADIQRSFAAAQDLPGPRIVLTHSPDITPDLPARVTLVAAGHTHCGQINLPLFGRPATMSRYGERYACGMIDDHGQAVLVSGGLGTSLVPIRIGAPPEFWIIELGR